MKNFYQLLTIVIFSLFNIVVPAQNIVQLSFYSPLISTFDMDYTNNHLVVSQNGLLIFDVSDPEKRPVLVGQTSYPGSTANDVIVQGNYAYMAYGNNGIFAVYNISDFTHPVLTGSVAVPAVSFYVSGDLKAHGSYVYMTGFDSLYVVNVSNPASPSVANAIPVSHTDFSGASDLAIDNNNLFVRTPFAIAVYNISDPVNPVFQTSIPKAHAYESGLEVDTLHHRLFSPWLTALQDYTGYDAYNISTTNPVFLYADSIPQGFGEFGVSAYSYVDTVLYISEGGSINAFLADPTTHHFVTSFSGEDVPNASVSIKVEDSIFYNAKRGGIEVLEYTNTIPFVCIAPEKLRTRVEGTTAFFQWNKVERAKGYIFRYRKANHPWIYDSLLTNVHRVRNLDPNSLYYWEVLTVCNIKNRQKSDFSLTERFNTGSSNLESTITISPNPVQDILKISLHDISAKEIVITNFMGNVVMRLPFVQNGQQVSFSKMAAGTYTVQALNAERKVVAKTSFLKTE